MKVLSNVTIDILIMGGEDPDCKKCRFIYFSSTHTSMSEALGSSELNF